MSAIQHFQLQGVRCNGCVSKIRKALQAKEASAELEFDLPSQYARIATRLTPDEVSALLTELEYQSQPMARSPLHLIIDGIKCNGCLKKVRAALEPLDEGIVLAADFAAKRLRVETLLPAAYLCQQIQALGYSAELVALETHVFSVQGVKCNGCVNKIRAAIEADDATAEVEADIPAQRLRVTSHLGEERLKALLTELDYLADSAASEQSATEQIVTEAPSSAQVESTSAECVATAAPIVPVSALNLSLSGITCAGCVASIEKALASVEGVDKVLVNFANRTALVEGSASFEAVSSAVDKAGYAAELIEDPSEADAKRQATEQRELKQRIKSAAFALTLGVPLMVHGFIYGMAVSDAARLWWIGIGVLTLVMLWVAGKHFFIGAWRNLQHGSANMDSLIALGTGSAWLFSMLVVLFPGWIPGAAQGLYFEAAAMIIGLVNLGQVLELRARGRTQSAVRALLDLRPKTARRLVDGEERDVPLEAVQRGDLLRVRPGEHVPVDAEVVEGGSQIDESMLTGEPMPVVKKVGDQLSAGTLNGNGSLLVRATRVGKDTALARIIGLVQRAQNSKPPISKLADTIASIFVPVVVVIALITAVVWFVVGPAPQLSYAVVTAVTVLIIACPCALGLATPISTMIGVGKAAERGVLIRSGEALQTASSLTTVVVDKTGTVTEGKPKVTQFELLGSQDKTAVLARIHALESRSEHPLAGAVVEYAEDAAEPLHLERFEAVSGQGVRAIIDGQVVLIGNRRLLATQGIDVTSVVDQVENWQQEAQTVIHVAIAGELVALLAIADPIRADSVSAIARLHRDGIRVVMLSGDNRATAEAVARQLNIDEVLAEMQPGDKLNQIEALQQRGEIVAMVGDGINDAPALSQANVGFALGSGTDVAIESADVALIRPSLHGVADAIELSRATLRNIKQNLWGAFAYNGLGIPVAAGLLYPFTGLLLSPVIAGLAMSISSVTVVSNANRLRLIKIGEQ